MLGTGALPAPRRSARPPSTRPRGPARDGDRAGSTPSRRRRPPATSRSLLDRRRRDAGQGHGRRLEPDHRSRRWSSARRTASSGSSASGPRARAPSTATGSGSATPPTSWSCAATGRVARGRRRTGGSTTSDPPTADRSPRALKVGRPRRRRSTAIVTAPATLLDSTGPTDRRPGRLGRDRGPAADGHEPRLRRHAGPRRRPDRACVRRPAAAGRAARGRSAAAAVPSPLVLHALADRGPRVAARPDQRHGHRASTSSATAGVPRSRSVRRTRSWSASPAPGSPARRSSRAASRR